MIEIGQGNKYVEIDENTHTSSSSKVTYNPAWRAKATDKKLEQGHCLLLWAPPECVTVVALEGSINGDNVEKDVIACKVNIFKFITRINNKLPRLPTQQGGERPNQHDCFEFQSMYIKESLEVLGM